MSSVGVFRKEEIDGKPFLVFTLTRIDNPTSSGEALVKDSGGNDLPLQPPFFCPRARIKFHELKLEMLDDGDGDDDDDDDDGDGDGNDDDGDDDVGDDEDEDHYKSSNKLHPFNSSPHFPSTRIGEQQGESLLDCDHNGVCKFPVVPLFWCNNKGSDSQEFECGACETAKLSTSYFACLQCQRKFHKECVESPLEIKHPSHPFNSLRLNSCKRTRRCICCEENLNNIFYNCSTWEFSMHPVCAMRSVPFVIEHPKSHPHPLTYFPTQAYCHFCAQVKKFDPTYICIQCVFAIHEDCIGFPHVIRISRHYHRLSFSSSRPSKKLSCGVCHQEVDNQYGAYSCLKCDACFVHSTCALHPKVWDGKELEGIPEEDDKIDDGEPFERIADGIVLHPFHCHRLRLEIFRAYDENKFCQGCALPIYEGQFYSCKECDFILHESCANAPLMKRHPLHPHPLALTFAIKTISGNIKGKLYCCACGRGGTGFFYEHHIGDNRFGLDIRCASILEPFKYQGHKHPLFLPWDPPLVTRCQLCKYESKDPKLVCLKCDYTICFGCATLPYKVRYKHDSHFLMICDEKEASDDDQPVWCEICECKIKEVRERDSWRESKKERRLYKCNDCCTTLHVKCLLGLDMYMKPGGNTQEDYLITVINQDNKLTDVWILLNNSLSRPICTICMRRCPFPIYIKGHNAIFCSHHCIRWTEHPEFIPLCFSFEVLSIVRCNFLFLIREKKMCF